MCSRLWSLLLVPLLLGAGQPIDPRTLVWDSSGGPDTVAGYEVVQGWDGAEVGSMVTGLSVPLAARTGTAYAARVRALPVDPAAQPSNWTTLAAEWPNALPQIVSLSQLGRTTAPLPGGGPVMADPAFGALGTVSSTGATNITSQSSTLTNVATGDLVLAFVQRDSQDMCSGVSMSGTTMTRLKRNSDGGGQGFNFDVWGVIAPGAVSSATITASYSTSDNWGSMVTARWSGVASATPNASSCNTTGCSGLASSSTNRLAQSITTSVRTLLIAAGTDWDDYRSHTPATGWAERADGSGSPVTSIQFLHDRVAAAGTYGGATAYATTGATDQYLSVLLAFEASDQGGAAAASLLPTFYASRMAHLLGR